MTCFTVRNAVILALVQVTVIVFGILTAGVAFKIVRVAEAGVPDAVRVLVNYGVVLLLVPLAWVSVALWVRQSATCSARAKSTAFFSGIAVLGFLMLMTWTTALRPLVDACFMQFGG